MSLPDTRDLTFIPGVSEVPSATLNALQDQEVAAWRAMRGGDLLVGDDFIGTAIDAGLWESLNAAIADDHANGAFGAVHLSPPGGGTANVASALLPLGQLDFRIAVLLRATNSGNLKIGLDSAIPAERVYLTGNTVSGQWNFVFPGGPAGTGVPVGAGYTLIEIYRQKGVAGYRINGVDFAPGAFTTTITAGFVTISSDSDAWVDCVKLWAARYPVGSAASLPPPAHEEDGIVVFTGVEDYVDVAFVQAFADTTYRVSATVGLGAAGDPVVGVAYANKALGTLRLIPDAHFTGEVSWRAWKR